MSFLSKEVMVVNNDLFEHGVELLKNTSESRMERVLEYQFTSKLISSA